MKLCKYSYILVYALFNPLIPLISQQVRCDISGISELFFFFTNI